MRVHFAKALIQVVTADAPMLSIRARVADEIQPRVETGIKHMPVDIQRQYNSDMALRSQTIDWVSEPIIYMPDEFAFDLDVESLGRLSREYLLELIPLYVRNWQIEYIEVADLWLGGKGEILDRDARSILSAETLKIRKMPVQGKSFVLGRDIEQTKRWSFEAAIKEAGGITREELNSADYFVTDDPKFALEAERGSVARIIDPLALVVILEG